MGDSKLSGVGTGQEDRGTAEKDTEKAGGEEGRAAEKQGWF